MRHQRTTTNVPLRVNEAEIFRIAVKTKPGAVQATLKGSLHVRRLIDGAAVGPCKYSYQRIDLAKPRVSGCPQ